MSVVTRGFVGRRDHSAKLPPGQHFETGFPVLTVGPAPRISTERWELTVTTETGDRTVFDWASMQALGLEELQVDIHCVTSWSKFDTRWRGVSVERVLAGISTSATHLMAHCYGGYTTNLPLADVLDGRALIATEFDGEPLARDHGGPARLLVPHLYFWKSAKWVSELRLMTEDELGFWERNGYHAYGDPWREQRYSDV
ncbi:sulfite oxidase-like oxidoreductase [Nakamurella sp. A5-74]|uniref:Sulfite oxidase-like oxidoreductase n=1 Tax=Nakamurella sp. A5-74 TaxID=3158264 RepID=A0AAU8DMQ4_9ACTN